MSSYIVYHPGTGTIIPADEAVLVSIQHLPDNPEEWEDHLARNGEPETRLTQVIDIEGT